MTVHIIVLKRKPIMNLCFEGNAIEYEYERRNMIHCANDGYGRYSKLSLAKSDCDLDPKCRGVYDSNCDNSNTFYLCPVSVPLESTWRTSCVYEKIGSEYLHKFGTCVKWIFLIKYFAN